MVVRGLLEIAAIVLYAILHVAGERSRVPRRSQRPARGKVGKKPSEGVQRDGLAEQVRIGREIDRQVVFEVQSVAIEFGQKALAKSRRHLRAEQVPNPNPRKRAKGDFQRAGPIDAALEGIFRPPVIELPKDALAVLLRAR